jgi:hypothetical protein
MLTKILEIYKTVSHANEMASGCRFADVLPTDLVELEKECYSPKTLYNDEYGSRLLRAFLEEKKMTMPSSKDEFDQLLVMFFASLRTKGGEHFTTGSIANIYQALSRVISRSHKFDIRSDPSLVKCRAMVKNMKAISKKKGKGVVNHTPTIAKEDLEKLGRMSFATPVWLQYKAWILLQLHFAKRGGENTHEMRKCDVLFRKTSDGTEYVELADTTTKNHRGSDTSPSYGGVMTATGGNQCPVAVVKFYLSKLHPTNESLWQRPKVSYRETDSHWYCDMKIGANRMRGFMSGISKMTNLSTIYTNHSLRATSISILGEQFEDTDVSTVSGHKSLSNLKIYKRTSVGRKCEMSSQLHRALVGNTENVDSQSDLSIVDLRTNMMDVEPQLDDQRDLARGELEPQMESQRDLASGDSQNKIMDLEPTLSSQQTVNVTNITGNGGHVGELASIFKAFAPVMNNCGSVCFNIHIHQ